MKFRMTTWSSVCSTLSKPHKGRETYAEYLAFDKEKQTALKDCGYYLIGKFTGDLRHNAEFERRGTITLDIDKAGIDFEEHLARAFPGLEFFWHTSRKSCPQAPRIRVHLPLSQDVTTADQYEALARMLAARYDIEQVDRVSFVPAQMMFFPSVSRDGVFEHGRQQGAWLDPLAELTAGYVDWADRGEWPHAAGEPPPASRKAHADSPLTKPGVIGAFCRAYSITHCLENLLPGVYEPADAEGRWRYHAAEGGAGAIVYDNDTALYSHHTGHDPVAGRSVNAFDLVRVHKYGALDVVVDADIDGVTPTSMPSFRAMRSYAMGLPEVVAELSNIEAFDELPEPGGKVGVASAMARSGEIVGDIVPAAQPLDTTPNDASIDELPDAGKPVKTGGSDDLPEMLGDAVVRARIREAIGFTCTPDELIDKVLPMVVGAAFDDAMKGMFYHEMSARSEALDASRRISVADLRKAGRELEKKMIGAKAGGGQHVELVYQDNGQPEVTVVNIEAFILAGLVGWRLAFDNFHGDAVRAPLDRDDWQPIKDADIVAIRKALERGGFRNLGSGNDLVKQAVVAICDEHVIDTADLWASRLLWDGVPRVEQFWSTYLGVEDTEYSRACGRYWWSALAGRLVKPGVQADMMPILVGEQGLRKSSAARAMAPMPEHFTLYRFNMHDGDAGRKLRGKLVAEVGELRGMGTSSDEEGIKTFMTASEDIWVPKYKERATAYARRCMFIGTTDKKEFLSDSAGNRRWLPLPVNRVDVDGIRRDVEQLYAEGLERFVAGGVDFSAEKLAEAMHAEFSVSDLWDQDVRGWLQSDAMEDLDGGVPVTQGCRPFTTNELLSGLDLVKRDRRDRVAEIRISKILHRFGYERKTGSRDGVAGKFWRQKGG